MSASALYPPTPSSPAFSPLPPMSEPTFATVTNMASGEDYFPLLYPYADNLRDHPTSIQDLSLDAQQELSHWGLTSERDVKAFFASRTPCIATRHLRGMRNSHLRRFLDDPALRESFTEINKRRLETGRLATAMTHAMNEMGGSSDSYSSNALLEQEALLRRAGELLQELEQRLVPVYFIHLDRYVREVDGLVWLSLQRPGLEESERSQIIDQRDEDVSHVTGSIVPTVADAAYLGLLMKGEDSALEWPEWRRRRAHTVSEGCHAEPAQAGTPTTPFRARFVSRRGSVAGGPPPSPAFSSPRRQGGRTST